MKANVSSKNNAKRKPISSVRKSILANIEMKMTETAIHQPAAAKEKAAS